MSEDVFHLPEMVDKERQDACRKRLMQGNTLLASLDRADRLLAIATEKHELDAVKLFYRMLREVAIERRLREQADRAEGGITLARTRLGEMQTDARKDNPGGDRKTPGSIIPTREGLISNAEKKERVVNKKLGERGSAEVKRTVDAFLDEGVPPTPGRVLRQMDVEDVAGVPEQPLPAWRVDVSVAWRMEGAVVHADDEAGARHEAAKAVRDAFVLADNMNVDVRREE